MAGPQKASTFSFGQPAANSKPSMFGQPAATSQPQSGGLFGSAPNPPATSGGGGLFGSNPSSATSGTGLFGSTQATSSRGGGLFGSTPTSTAAGGGAGGLFSSTPTSTAAGGGSLFGSTTPAPGGGSVFNAFAGGNKTDSSSTSFGQQPSRTSTAPPGIGLFGSNSAFSQASQPASAATSSSPFDFQTPNKDASNKPAQNTNPFGSTTNPQGGSMFSLNTSSSTTPASKPTSNLFASTTPAGPPPTSGIEGSSSTLFSFTKPPGQDNQTQKPASSSSAAPSLFGNVSQPSSSSNAVQSPSTTTAAAPSIFNTTPKASAASGGGLFSNLGKPQDDAGPPKSSFFSPLAQTTAASSTTPASTPPNAAPKSSATPFSFMKSSEPASSAPAVSSSGPSGGGFSLGNYAVTTSASTESSAPVQASSAFSLGKPQASATTTSAPTSSAPAPTSNLFSNLGKQPATTSNASQAPAQDAFKPTTAGAAQASNMAQPSNAAQGPNMSASTAGPAPPAASRLKNKSMDEIVTGWATKLSEYTKAFQTQAEKVAKWDRLLVENSEKIQKLYGQTLGAERSTAEVERQLTAVENDQDELEAMLDFYEKQVDDMLKAQGDTEIATGPDAERQQTYQLAGTLSERLDEMSKDLGSMIEEINDATSNLSKANKPEDPLSQVVRVLNGHLSQLQEIDQGAAALSQQVQEMQKASRAFGSGNGNGKGGLGGPSSDAADGFWKSYSGRK